MGCMASWMLMQDGMTSLVSLLRCPTPKTEINLKNPDLNKSLQYLIKIDSNGLDSLWNLHVLNMKVCGFMVYQKPHLKMPVMCKPSH